MLKLHILLSTFTKYIVEWAFKYFFWFGYYSIFLLKLILYLTDRLFVIVKVHNLKKFKFTHLILLKYFNFSDIMPNKMLDIDSMIVLIEVFSKDPFVLLAIHILVRALDSQRKSNWHSNTKVLFNKETSLNLRSLKKCCEKKVIRIWMIA